MLIKARKDLKWKSGTLNITLNMKQDFLTDIGKNGNRPPCEVVSNRVNACQDVWGPSAKSVDRAHWQVTGYSDNSSSPGITTDLRSDQSSLPKP